jgi:adenosyl cobinamide kinase/adenosyl cobinamide phosphate guanylyltransferase
VITFVLGGARSGKSEVAERLAGADVTFLATWRFDPADTEMAARWPPTGPGDRPRG